MPRKSGTSAILAIFLLARITLTLADDNSPRCTFNLGSLKYDLCSIVKAASPIHVYHSDPTPPTRTTLSYAISLTGPIKRNESLPAYEQCPEGTWVCMKMYNFRPEKENEAPRLVQLVPVASSAFIPSANSAGVLAEDDPPKHNHLNISAALGRQPSSEKHPPLEITLHGGMYVNAPQKAVLSFWCDESISEVSKPAVEWHFGGVHVFSWRTKYACATNGYGEHKHAPSDNPEKDNNKRPSQDRDRKFPETDLQRPQKQLTWFWLGTISLLVAMVYLLLGFLRRSNQWQHLSFPSLPWPLSLRRRNRTLDETDQRQLLWAAEGYDVDYVEHQDPPPGPQSSSGKGSRPFGFDVEEMDIEDLQSPTSASRGKGSTQKYPTYGVAQPRWTHGRFNRSSTRNAAQRAFDSIRKMF